MSRHLDRDDLERRQKRNRLLLTDIEMGVSALLIILGIAMAGHRMGEYRWQGIVICAIGAILFVHCMVTYPSSIPEKPKAKADPVPEDENSPWWGCPECGGIRFHAVVVFEKGIWEDDDTYVVEYPPTGYVNTVEASVLECCRCQHRFKPSEAFGWYTKAEVPE